MSASKPLKAYVPAIFLAKSTFSTSDNLENAVRKSVIVCIHGFIVPSLFLTERPSACIALAASFGGAARRIMIDRRLVPACSPLMPAFAIRPMATPTSSILYFSVPASGATYLKVSPIMLTLVFEFVAACAKTSAKCPESDAFSPNAVKASVTISETLPSSSPDAAARSITPLTPCSISGVFHPAIAIYSNAFPASVAGKDVVMPISLALFDNSSMSAADA